MEFGYCLPARQCCGIAGGGFGAWCLEFPVRSPVRKSFFTFASYEFTKDVLTGRSSGLMTTNELKVLAIIWDWGGEASVDIIAREAGISIDYARLLGESLAREGCIEFLHSKLGKIKSKGKILVAEKRGQNFTPPRNGVSGAGPKKIVIPERPSRFGLGKDKRGRLILNY